MYSLGSLHELGVQELAAGQSNSASMRYVVLLIATLPKGRFPLPELTARVDGCQKMHPSYRAVKSARKLG